MGEQGRTDLAQDKDKWLEVVNAAINLQIL